MAHLTRCWAVLKTTDIVTWLLYKAQHSYQNNILALYK